MIAISPATAFRRAEKVTLVYEGGYANNRKDPGGVTLEGVTQRVYNPYRDRVGKPRQVLTPAMRGTREWIADRDAIYRAQYWNAVRGDELPEGVNLVLFDGAVHSGPYQSIKWLQKALRMNDADGHLGEGTLNALENHPDHGALIAEICARRLGMYQQLGTWSTFGDGWAKRVTNVKQVAQAWAAEEHHAAPAPLPVHEDGGNAKAYASDVVQPAMDADTAVKTGIGTGTLTAGIDGAKDALAPVAYSSDWVMKIFTVLTVIGVVIAIGSLGYSLWASHKTKKAQRAIDGDIVADVPEGQPA